MWKPSWWTALIFLSLQEQLPSVSLSAPPLIIFTCWVTLMIFFFPHTDEKWLKKHNHPPLRFSKLILAPICATTTSSFHWCYRYLILISFYWVTLHTRTTFIKVLVVWWYEDQKIETVYTRDNTAINNLGVLTHKNNRWVCFCACAAAPYCTTGKKRSFFKFVL